MFSIAVIMAILSFLWWKIKMFFFSVLLQVKVATKYYLP